MILCPSFSENIESGNYLDAGLQTLGASGDVMLAASPFFQSLRFQLQWLKVSLLLVNL